MQVLVLLPWLFVIITAQDTLYSVDQLLQRGISSGDGVSTYAVDGDDGAIQSNDGLNANLEEQQQKKLQNLGTMFLRMAQAAGLRENKIKRPPYPPTNPHGGPVQMYTVSGGPLLPGQLIVSDFHTRRGEEVDVDTRSGGEVDFDPRRAIMNASGPTEKPKREPYMKLKLQGYVYRMHG
ncbi:uncharacterized protein LOC125490858 [Plutella xylostella]|uniref:uncharacterized protein LOC125490858 n=1 Tax=Plutella xylostella TaxID=51655 RepID=UPI0020322EC8|nr:uncharacterized protein LOC125490858 [Plutella xylostella]